VGPAPILQLIGAGGMLTGLVPARASISKRGGQPAEPVVILQPFSAGGALAVLVLARTS
jgi:hypothetical protein